MFPGASGPRTPKSLRKSRKQSEKTLSTLSGDSPETSQTVSETFWRLLGVPGPEAPGDNFETFSAFRARRARETSVRGGLVPNLLPSSVQCRFGCWSATFAPGKRRLCPMWCLLWDNERVNREKKGSIRTPHLGVQSWSPFLTRKSGHIWRVWAEMTQTIMPKSTKVGQIHLPECNSPKFAKFPPKFRQNSPNFHPNSPNFVSQEGSNFQHLTS